MQKKTKSCRGQKKHLRNQNKGFLIKKRRETLLRSTRHRLSRSRRDRKTKRNCVKRIFQSLKKIMNSPSNNFKIQKRSTNKRKKTLMKLIVCRRMTLGMLRLPKNKQRSKLTLQRISKETLEMISLSQNIQLNKNKTSSKIRKIILKMH